ncbi:MAG: hypothetical protein K2Y22_14735 [Candidatus Obscuribacterales bacterium]|nr:hypothetical protein [Candidatus Obscuribacterales bacterium]
MRKNILTSLLTFAVAASACLLTACSSPALPEVDIGERTSKVGWMDGEKKDRITLSASDVAFGSPTAPVTITRTYGHGTRDAEQIYRIKSSATADFVPSQKAYMIWVDSALFSFETPYQINKLNSKPSVTIGKPTNTSGFYEVSGGRQFKIGRVSFDGSTLSVHVVRQFCRQGKYVDEYFSDSVETIAEYVQTQNGWMFYMGSQLYKVNQTKTSVDPLYSKPAVDLGIRHDLVSGQDNEDRSKREVTATGWNLDQTRLVVDTKQHYKHDTRFETEVYVVERELYAVYSSLYEGWVVEVSGDTYLFDIDGCRSQDATRDSKLKFANVPAELKRPSKKTTCNPKPEQPAPKPPAEKPEINAGRLTEKMQNFDKENMDRRKVTPLKLNDENNTYDVMVTRHYVNVSKTELTKYYIQKQLDAKYDASKRGYVLEVGKDTYVITKSGKIRQQ